MAEVEKKSQQNKEDEFLEESKNLIQSFLQPPFVIEAKEPLYYELNVSNRLEIGANPRRPKRGYSAFQTDLCIFEKVSVGSEEIKLPRVVMEFKTKITTHDILTYSAKAKKHKDIYPYLRYGLVSSRLNTIPGRVFKHNEALDFCFAAGLYTADQSRLGEVFKTLIEAEIKASKQLEMIFEQKEIVIFRNEVILEDKDGKRL